MRNWIQHHLNPLHVYCRLMDMGCSQARAWEMASAWDRIYSRYWRAHG